LKHVADNDELLTQYLLGELSEEEQEGVEQRYISDSELYGQLLAVEDELIDAYVEGELPQSRRARFEAHFMRSPGRQERVEFAKAWMAYVSRGSRNSTAAQRTAALPRRSFSDFFGFESWPVAVRVSLAVVMLMAGVFLIAEIVRLRSRFEQAESQRAALEKNQRELQQQIDEERQRSQELSSQLESERSAPDLQDGVTTQPTGIISLLLTPGLVRGSGDAKRLVIPPEARQVRLQVSFPRGDRLVSQGRAGERQTSTYDRYSVIIQTVEGKTVWTKSGLTAQRSASRSVVAVPVPAGILTTEDYILTLNGQKGAGSAETISEYFFSVSKR
jgi:putative zinc finger protein